MLVRVPVRVSGFPCVTVVGAFSPTLISLGAQSSALVTLNVCLSAPTPGHVTATVYVPGGCALHGVVEQFCKLQLNVLDNVCPEAHVELEVTATVCVFTVAPLDE